MQQKKSTHHPAPEENIVQQITAKFLPYWPLFIAAIIAGALAAVLYTRYSIPKYQATAKIIIKDEKKGAEESKLTESLNTISSKQLVENEIEVMQSRKLMNAVVLEQHLYAPILQKGKLHNTSAYLTSPVLVTLLRPEELTEVKNIPLSYSSADKTATINNQKYPLNQVVNSPYGSLKIIENKWYKKSAGQADGSFSFSLIKPTTITDNFLQNLEVTAASKLSTIIQLKLKDEVPERAEAVLNGVIKAYDLSALQTKNDLAKNTLAFVEERLGTIGGQLDSIQRKEQQYRAGAGAVDIGTQGQLFLQNVSENDQKLSIVNTQMSVLNQLESFVSDRNAEGGSVVPSTVGVSDPLLTQMLDKLNAAEMEYEKLRKTVGENHPKLVAINDQINLLKPGILDNIKSQKQSLAATRQTISATNGGYNSMLRSMPAKEKAIVELTRDKLTLTGIYQFLLQKREESVLSFSSVISANRVVDAAQAGTKPVSPNKKLVYAACVLGALFLLVLFITAREIFTGKILYRKEITDYTAFPVIAELAHDPSKNAIIVEPSKRTYGTEAFRKLRSSLSYLGIDEQHKKILVTSGISGEGKSFIAANLAISLASTGKKVVLVDMDLNDPSLSKIFDVNAKAGVSDYLSGKGSEANITNKLPKYDNLSFIAAGKLVDAPSELMMNGKVQELINKLELKYDVVLIDTSPVMLITDALLLSGLCDATLYVVRHKYTPKNLVKRLDENNIINPLHNVGIVFNGVKGRGVFNNEYGQGYGYGYVYGNNEKQKTSLFKRSANTAKNK